MCNKRPSGWSFHTLGGSQKCLFVEKTRVEISQLEIFCKGLNATVPYPKNNEENKNYRDVFDSMNISESVAIKSCHGMVELESNAKWNPFPTEMTVNVVCEKPAAYRKTRFKRQGSSGTYYHIQ